MATEARIDSIDALRGLRVSLWKFIESAQAALGDSESDIQKTIVWLSGEQDTFWTHQIRIRTEAVNKAKDKVREKTLYKDASGRVQSAVDEQKALKIAQRRLEEAEQKLIATRKWARRLQQEAFNYKGGVQRLATMLSVDLPTASAKLDKLSQALGKYVAGAPQQVTSTAGAEVAGASSESTGGSMSRGEGSTAEFDLATPPEGFPELAEGQFAGYRWEQDAEGRNFRTFATKEEAETWARESVGASPNLQLAIYDHQKKLIVSHRPASTQPQSPDESPPTAVGGNPEQSATENIASPPATT